MREKKKEKRKKKAKVLRLSTNCWALQKGGKNHPFYVKTKSFRARQSLSCITIKMRKEKKAPQ